MAEKRARRAVVVGAGPVGCLASLSLAKMGWEVELYDGRPGKIYPVIHESLSRLSTFYHRLGLAAM